MKNREKNSILQKNENGILQKTRTVFCRNGRKGRKALEESRKDIFWNALGSMVYALASMILAFFVLRLLGEREGGIFGFGYSTLGQQFFILAYFGIRPFQITDMKGEFSFKEYLGFRNITAALAFLFSSLFLLFQFAAGQYDAEKTAVLSALCLYKIIDGYIDVYESELQRRGKLYKTGQSLFFRTCFSVLALLLCLLSTGKLFFSVCVMNLAEILSFFAFCVLPLGKTEALAVERPLTSSSVRALFQENLLLFLSVFLDFYVFSASKYAVDAVLGSSYSGIYNLLFMPSNFIYLLANFIIRPALPHLAALWQAEERGGFRKEERKILRKIVLLSALLLFLALLLSFPALWILERLLGAAFYGKMTKEQIPFCIMILGGCFYALANLEYYLLVTKRRQGRIFLGYAVAAVLSFLSANFMVRQGHFFLAAVEFSLLMFFLFVFFFVSEETDR